MLIVRGGSMLGSGGRRGAVMLLTLIVWLCASSRLESRAHADDAAPEPLVKAEFMERITRFVDWPDDSFSSDDTPFSLCVMGEHPFGSYLDKLARERRVQGRRIVLRSVTDVSKLGGCHLLFVAHSEDKRLDKILAAVAGLPVLTVSDSTGYAARGVLVNFYRDGENVRFEINVRAVDKSGLRFSSKILRLARLVGKRP
jgi:hypothetical protein